ncbi:Crp/Fnr family transcriptional regulator [Muribaculum intestinale]|uniref:Crp/Fnr family transcriptional regulator n=3 Tax=Muribaculaceae TaxID=2005473 RepID=UPI0025B51589|nr:Crp/Fnr family transcriptional regulator [Muribaculum intestinale]
MKENFNTYIDHIEPDFWRELCVKKGKLRHYERGEEFAKVGQVARYIGYIKSGTLKYVAFSVDGTEHVVGMEFAGEFVSDFPFSLSGIEARVSIVAVTPCDIYCFPVQEMVKRMREDANVKDIVMRSSEAVFSTVYDRYMALYCKTPQQRYDELVSRHPNLFTLFSLKDIASFLNITPTHLSRLRKDDGKLC